MCEKRIKDFYALPSEYARVKVVDISILDSVVKIFRDAIEKEYKRYIKKYKTY